MYSLLSLFAFCVALVIAITKVVLDVMQEKDRAKGMVVNSEEYKMSFLVKSVLKDRLNEFKEFVGKIFKRKKQ